MTEFASPKDLAVAALGGDPVALERYLDALKTRNGARGVYFGSHMGLEMVTVESDRVTMRMAWRDELRRGGGIFHGGALLGLADHVAGCVFNTDPRISAADATGVTVDFSMSFLLSAAPGEALLATGTVLRRGKTVTFLQVDVAGETSGRAVATCRTTYLTVPRSTLGR